MILKNLLYQEENQIGTLTFHRPEVKNAIDVETMEELDFLLGQVEKGQTVRVLILTGSGEESFVAGGDLKYFQSLDNIYKGRQMSLYMQGILNRLEGMEIPSIALLNGYAFGGGFETALACDFRIAAQGIRIGFQQIKMGIMTGWGGGQRLLRLIGRSRALELLLTASIITAEEALSLGLVNRVVPASELMSATRELARRITQNPPLAVKYMKRAIHVGQDLPLRAAIDLEAELFCTLWASEDHDEAVRAFMEKRSPQFKGR